MSLRTRRGDSPADRSLARLPNVHRLEPLSYADFCRLISASALILSDSGGVQEEAPAVGVPVLVLRETTERAEAVEAGVARLVGTDPAVIEPAVSEELARTSSPGAREHMVSPFGDGLAAQRAVVAIEVLLRGGRWPGDFEPAAHLVDVSALSTELALGSDRS